MKGKWGKAVDIVTIIESFKPVVTLLSDVADEYIEIKKLNPKPVKVALATFISLAGDRDVSEYSREDAKLFVRHLTL